MAKLDPISMTKDLVTIMKFGGCSPKKSRRYLGFTYIFFSVVIVILLVIKWYLSPPNTAGSIIESCVMIFGFLQIAAKYFTSVIYNHVFAKILNNLYNDFWSLDDFEDENYKKEAQIRYKIANMLQKMYGIVLMSAVCFFCMQAVIKGNNTLVMDIWMPYSQILRTSPYYEIMFFLQSIFYFSSVFLSVNPLDRMFILYTCFICEQYKMIRKRIAEINESKSVNTNFEIIRKCVIHNNLIDEFIRDFEFVYSKLLLTAIATDFILLSICMYGLIMEESLERKITSALIYMAVIVQFLAYCLAGQLIQDEGELLGEAAYDCPWYDTKVANHKTTMAIAMIILKSQRKIEINVGGFMVLSLERYAAVLQASFSFLTFIVNVRN